MTRDRDRIPLSVKVLHTAFVLVLVPAYWQHYGPGNFLWFSDIALFVSVPALWLRSSLLASTQALAVLLLEIVWALDFFAKLVVGSHVVELTDYMFEEENPLFIRALSLFHLWLPPLLLWMVYEYGYDRRAWLVQSLVAWTVLPATLLLTRPEDNVNWVHELGAQFGGWPPWLNVLCLMVALPLLLYWPTHAALQRLMRGKETPPLGSPSSTRPSPR